MPSDEASIETLRGNRVPVAPILSIREAMEHPHLIARVEKDTGQSNALNRAFALAQGEIICWLNADDQYLPGGCQTAGRQDTDG